MFVGERRKDTFIIVNDLKQKVTLTYLGKKFLKRDYYTTTFDFKGTTYTNVYIVTEGWFKIIGAGKWVDYDLVFADDSHTTYCNYQ